MEDLEAPVGPPPGPASPPSNDRFAAFDGMDGASADAAKCQVCGTALTDEFDKVIGLCDVHQRDRRGGESAGTSVEPGGSRWYARTREGRVAGPMALDDLRSRIRQGEFSPSDEFSKDGVGYAPLSKYQEIAYLAGISLGEAGIASVGARPRMTYARSSQSGVGRVVTWGLAALVAGGIAFLLFSERDKLAELYGRITSDSKPQGPSTPNPLRRQLANWRLAHPDVSGTAHEHLVTARARHLEDTWRGYQLAEDAFERALLLDENDPAAIAGYVENFAIWRYPVSTQDEVRTAQAALRYATELSPDHAAVHRASAALGLARGELNLCRAGADKALEKDATDGMAKLLLAGCYLEGNVQLATSEAEHAVRLLPELRRADRVLAAAYAKVGRFASALRLLDRRLKDDPKNASVHVLYGNIARDLAQLELAQDHYREAIAAGGDVQEAHLALAEVLLEGDNAAAASQELKKAAEMRGAQPERMARAYAAWGRAELARGRAQQALELSRTALSFAPRDPEALLVSGEAALRVGSATTAAAQAKRALDARSGEPSALVLAGRTAALERQREKAIKHFEDAIANDPTDPRLRGILAALYLGIGGTQQAYTLMRKASEIDPQERLSRSRVGPLQITAEPVREAIESFRKSASEEANASVASSSIGMLHYHLGDRPRAAEAIARALKIDDSNVTALLYDAQLALDRGDAARAQASAERILAIERGSALGHLMLARAYARKGNRDAAREQYGSALRSNPGLLAAKVEVSGLDLEAGDRDRAVAELARAFQLNPHSLVTRRLLQSAGF